MGLNFFTSKISAAMTALLLAKRERERLTWRSIGGAVANGFKKSFSEREKEGLGKKRGKVCRLDNYGSPRAKVTENLSSSERTNGR